MNFKYFIKEHVGKTTNDAQNNKQLNNKGEGVVEGTLKNVKQQGDVGSSRVKFQVTQNEMKHKWKTIG